jgi:hypothetical protein
LQYFSYQNTIKECLLNYSLNPQLISRIYPTDVLNYAKVL